MTRAGVDVRVLRTRILAVLGSAALVTAAFSASASQVSASAKAAVSSKTVWLCKPGQANDPCVQNLNATSVAASGARKKVKTALPATPSKFDCFYVYPTVSTESTDNADLKVQPAETVTAALQASRFSQVCNVWAPMYRQRTLASLLNNLGGDKAGNNVAYNSLLSAWKDYLAHDNDGRPVIFIGHSQGAAMLIRLLRNEIDPSPKLRKLMVSALLMGGNVQVPTGKVVGGTFRHIPTCTSAGQTGCVIAYSSFASKPPLNSLFGRPGQGVSLQSNQTATSGQQVACVNPVNLSSATGSLLPYFSGSGVTIGGVKVTTPWVTYPGLYTASCKSSSGATWLQISTTSIAGDPRPKVTATLGPTWGLHLDDVNLALGNLVLDVAFQESGYR